MAHILIVDNEKSIRISVSTILRQAGLHVETAENAEVAIELLTARDFDVVLSDIYLNNIDCTEFLKLIRSASPNVQVVLMTEKANVDSASDAIRASAFDYIKKPLTKEKIIRVVRNAVRIKTLDDERRRLEKENREYKKNFDKLLEERTKSLMEGEGKDREILNSIPDIIYIIDSKHLFKFYHSSKTSELNLLPEDFVGKKVIDILPTFVAEKTIESVKKVINSKKEYLFEYSLKVGNKLHFFESCMVPTGQDEVLTIVRELPKGRKQKKE